MPMYEFECSKCNNKEDVLTRKTMSDLEKENIKCSKCGAKSIKKPTVPRRIFIQGKGVLHTR